MDKFKEWSVVFILACIFAWGLLGSLEMMNIGEGTP